MNVRWVRSAQATFRSAGSARPATRGAAVVPAVLLVLLVLPARAGFAAAAAASQDPRATPVLSRECTSDLGRETLTLFWNGTIRLRTELRSEPGTDLHRGAERRERKTWLGELAGDELEAYVARVRAESLREVESSRRGVVGSWVERCELVLTEEPAAPARRYAWGRYDALPLGLRRVLDVVEDLALRVDRTVPPIEAPSLPVDYQPRVGDVLRRHDGAEFRIVAFTGVGGGIELVGRDQPLVIYVLTAELRRSFVAVVKP